jgi:hypothetical protein
MVFAVAEQTSQLHCCSLQEHTRTSSASTVLHVTQ